MKREKNFIETCFTLVMSSGVKNVFFTLNPDGTYSDIAWFPQNKAVKCYDEFLSKFVITEESKLPNKPIHMDMSFMKKPVISIE